MRVRPGEITIDGRAEIATIAAVTPELAGALAIPLTDGVVLSHRIWESELGGKEDALGSNVRIDNAEYRIGGIAPENLEGLYSDQNVDLWIQSRENLEGGSQDRRDLWVLAHLREDVSTHQAQAALRSGPAGLHDISVASFTGIAPNMTLQQVKDSEKHQSFAVLRKHLIVHHRSDASIPVEKRREVFVGTNLAPIDRWICSNDSQAARGRKALIERADERKQLLVEAGCSAHLQHCRVSPDMLNFGVRNILAGDVPVQNRLVPYVATFDNNVVDR